MKNTKPEENKFHKGNGVDQKHYWLTPPSLWKIIKEKAKSYFQKEVFDGCPFPFDPEKFDGLVNNYPTDKVTYLNIPFGATIHNGKKKGATAWARKMILEQEKGATTMMAFPIDKWVLMLLAAGAKVENLGDVKWLATEDGSEGKGTGRHIALFILESKDKEPQAQ